MSVPLSSLSTAFAGLIVFSGAVFANEQKSSDRSWWSGNWSVNLGAAVLFEPRFVGADDQIFRGQPIISVSRSDMPRRFSTRNDGISFGLFDNGTFRAGPVARFVRERSNDTADLRGLRTVPWGVEAGVFVDYFPLEWLRLRSELRHGFKAHEGVRGDINLDAFADVSQTVRISGGPRISFASGEYFRTYYGISTAASLASGLRPYNPNGGINSVGFGGAISWRTTEKLTTTLFAEYTRLLGPAADSSLVRERGSKDQLKIGVSASYRFDFC